MGGADVYVTSRSPHCDSGNIHYILGDAKNKGFMNSILEEPWDAILDFMWYSFSEFKERHEKLLGSTRQYLFLSSARVYAPSKSPIVESSPRLLDASTDEAFLKTDEYALDKAREEDVLFRSGMRNWTILRPYITYNVNRLQLGVLEKEYWLYRALNNRTVLFHESLLDRVTTLSHGRDVARMIVGLIGNGDALGEAVHLAPAEPVRWGSVLKTYSRALEGELGSAPRVRLVKETSGWEEVMGNHYQMKYDRLSDRLFDNSKACRLCGGLGDAVAPGDGLPDCLAQFLQNGMQFNRFSWVSQAYMDGLSGEWASRREFARARDRAKYAVTRCLPPAAIARAVRARRRIKR